ncbi:MAG: molecular chaperone TorD family protein [Gammaproteobacteria bacterium]|nr:molecular chaperone TorD family protein [Gammaproteobacteria bacterium]
MNIDPTSFGKIVALDLMTLAQLHDRELDRHAVRALRDDGFPRNLGLRLTSQDAATATVMLAGGLAALSLTQRALDELAADFAAIYLNNSLGAHPCESVWLDEDGLAMQEPMFQVRERYAQFGFRVPDWRKRADDHLVFQLQFVAALVEDQRRSSLVAAADFLDMHLLRWLPGFAGKVTARAATPLYAGVAMLTSIYVDELRNILAALLDEPRPTADEVEARARRQVSAPPEVPVAYLPGSAPTW